MEIKKPLLILTKISIVIIIFFVGFLAFSWRGDVSDEKPYKDFINKSQEVKRPFAIYKNPTGNRFSEYSLSEFYNELKDKESTIKVYNISDTIKFNAAKSFFSNHVGTNYYLIGEHTLESGKTITFEYFLSEYSPKIWESKKEFLESKNN